MQNKKIIKIELIVSMMQSLIIIQYQLSEVLLKEFDDAKNNVIDSDIIDIDLEKKLANISFELTTHARCVMINEDNLKYYNDVLEALKEEYVL
jgi:hypothetical protein